MTSTHWPCAYGSTGNGGDSRTLKYVEMPMSAGGPALLQHRIDAMVIEPPN